MACWLVFRFEDDSGNTFAVNSDRYLEFLQRKFIPVFLWKANVDPHGAILWLLLTYQRNWWSSFQQLFLWHAAGITERSDCLAHQKSWPKFVCLFFLWGFLTDHVYINPMPQSLDELKNRKAKKTSINTLWSGWLLTSLSYLYAWLSPRGSSLSKLLESVK